MIAIARSFGSVSTEALLVISGLLPIDLRIKEGAAMRFLALSPHGDFSLRTYASIHRFVSQHIANATPSTRFFSSSHPPWSGGIRTPILLPRDGPIPLLASTPRTRRVYTDGSVIGGRTGYGAVVCSDTSILATCRGRLPDGCSIFQAEGAGLRAVLKYLMTMALDYDSVDILVDSCYS